MLKKFYIIFLVLQEIIAIKDVIPHLCCSHYAEKRKILPKIWQQENVQQLS